MRKIPTLFLRDFTSRPAFVTREVTPGCEWVIAGEGEATRKYDGTCFMLDASGAWWGRREVKEGKTPPPGFTALARDEETGKTVGWHPAEESSFAKIHAEAVAASGVLRPATYELLGPKINGNPEGYETHLLIPHGWAALSIREEFRGAPRTFDGLRTWLAARPYEGIVWHHPDGRMAKLKRRDFPEQ